MAIRKKKHSSKQAVRTAGGAKVRKAAAAAPARSGAPGARRSKGAPEASASVGTGAARGALVGSGPGKTAKARQKDLETPARRQSSGASGTRVRPARPSPKVQSAAGGEAGTRVAPGAVVDVGSPLPAFELLDQDGRSVASRELAGKPFVLYFYPKDDTPGCTREACAFRDGIQAFQELGVTVIGVSPDSPRSHARFREKHRLPFTLLSDPERSLARRFGAFGRKVFMGRETEGILRSTFLVDARGRVARVWRQVRVDGHAAEVAAAARALAR